MIFGLPITFILLDFYVLAFFGWLYESGFVSIRDRKLTNRGFLIGPIIPLYGMGAVVVYLLLRPFSHIPSLLYFMGMIIATAVEYIASWILEKAFHTQWWDYSQEPYNFRGRIALIPSMFWGVLSLLLFDVLQPAAAAIIDLVPEKWVQPLLAVSLVVTTMDVIYTVFTMIGFRRQLERLYEFRKELEYMTEELSLGSLLETLRYSREWPDKFEIRSFSEWKELFEKKLAGVRAVSGEKDGRLNALEERFRLYWENRNSFLSRHPLTGNQRLLDAFPNMKLLSGKHTRVAAKEILMTIKDKTKRFRKK